MRCIACGSEEPREIHRCPALNLPPCPHCQAATELIGKVEEVLREVACEPYKDSNLESLLTTLRLRAINFLTLITEWKGKE